MSEEISRAERRAAAIRAAKEQFDKFPDSEKTELIAGSERAEDAARFVVNFGWHGRERHAQ